MQQRHSARTCERNGTECGGDGAVVEAKPNLERGREGGRLASLALAVWLTAMSSFQATAKKLDRSPAAQAAAAGETDTLLKGAYIIKHCILLVLTPNRSELHLGPDSIRVWMIHRTIHRDAQFEKALV